MAWKNFIGPHAITSRRRVVASALMYGLSLTVRFTSPTGEETEISGASGSKHQSDAFDHDQGRRPDFQGLASEACSFNRLSARLAAQFQKLPRGMRTPHADAGLPAAIKVGRLRFTSSRRRRSLPPVSCSSGNARIFENIKPQERHMRLVIIGAGFAGMYAALSAARLRDIQGVSPEELEIALVAPEPTLVVRPRLYEPKPETLTAPLLDVLRAIDVVYVQGSAETIDSQIPHGRHRRRQGYEEEPLLRPAGRGDRQPAVPSKHSGPQPSTDLASTHWMMRSPSTSICTAWRNGRR